MKRFASTRSEKCASQPWPGRAQWSVGSIDEDGIRYGFTIHALIASTIGIAPMIVTAQSIAIRARREAGSPSAGRSGSSASGVASSVGLGCRRRRPGFDGLAESGSVWKTGEAVGGSAAGGGVAIGGAGASVTGGGWTATTHERPGRGRRAIGGRIEAVGVFEAPHPSAALGVRRVGSR